MPKHSEELTENDVKLVELVLSGGLTALQAYIQVFPKQAELSNSELIRQCNLLFSLPKIKRELRNRREQDE